MPPGASYPPKLVIPIQPDMVDSVRVMRDSSLAQIVITLTPAATLAWKREASAKSHPWRRVVVIASGTAVGAALGTWIGWKIATR